MFSCEYLIWRTTASAVPHKNLLLKVKSSLALTEYLFLSNSWCEQKRRHNSVKSDLVWTKLGFAFAPEICYYKYAKSGSLLGYHVWIELIPKTKAQQQLEKISSITP